MAAPVAEVAVGAAPISRGTPPLPTSRPTCTLVRYGEVGKAQSDLDLRARTMALPHGPLKYQPPHGGVADVLCALMGPGS